MRRSNLREPQVSGQFYPSSPQALKNQIETLIDKKAKKQDVIACILPHAGYMYSGGVAAETVSQINVKDKIILLGPNHSGYGLAYSIMTEGVWQTPLGEVNIDSYLAKQILKHSKYLREDSLAHAYEHSLEVELPILQYFKTDFEIVPIIFLSGDIGILKEIGSDIASGIKESDIKNSILIVASSDMTHYESQTQAQKKDQEAIKAILELNEEKLMERIKQLNISMCGYAPVIAMLSCVKLLGAKTARLVKYQTSGDITGDITSVVGYAGIVIY